jgi:transposase-like protein
VLGRCWPRRCRPRSPPTSSSSRTSSTSVFPATREQRCWFHKIAKVLNALPKSAQPGAKAALAEIWNAEDREHAEAAARSFVAEYATKWPKAVAKLTDDLDVLLEFYNYPAEHWVHLTRQSAGLDSCSCAREGAPDEC